MLSLARDSVVLALSGCSLGLDKFSSRVPFDLMILQISRDFSAIGMDMVPLLLLLKMKMKFTSGMSFHSKWKPILMSNSDLSWGAQCLMWAHTIQVTTDDCLEFIFML